MTTEELNELELQFQKAEKEYDKAWIAYLRAEGFENEERCHRICEEKEEIFLELGNKLWAEREKSRR